MIEIRALCKSYKGKVIYQDLNLSFKEAEMTAITGSSGCGKTTLLRMIAGLEPYDAGEIIGVKGKRIAYVFQEDRLMPWLNVRDNIAYVLASYLSPERIQQKVSELLKLLKLEDYEQSPIQTLSGGMQRRVAIARALGYESDLLLLDEPFKGLDDPLKWYILQEISTYCKQKLVTVICVTHDQEVARQFSHQVNLEKNIQGR